MPFERPTLLLPFSRMRIGIAISTSRSGILGFDECGSRAREIVAAAPMRVAERIDETSQLDFLLPNLYGESGRARKREKGQGIYIWVNWRVAEGSGRPRGALRVIFTGPSCARW